MILSFADKDWIVKKKYITKQCVHLFSAMAGLLPTLTWLQSSYSFDHPVSLGRKTRPMCEEKYERQPIKIWINPYKAWADEVAESWRAMKFQTQIISFWYTPSLTLKKGLKNKYLAVQSLPWPKWTCKLLPARICPSASATSNSMSCYPENFSNTHTHLMFEEGWRRLGVQNVQAGVITWFVSQNHLFFRTTPPKDQL